MPPLLPSATCATITTKAPCAPVAPFAIMTLHPFVLLMLILPLMHHIPLLPPSDQGATINYYSTHGATTPPSCIGDMGIGPLPLGTVRN